MPKYAVRIDDQTNRSSRFFPTIYADVIEAPNAASARELTLQRVKAEPNITHEWPPSTQRRALETHAYVNAPSTVLRAYARLSKAKPL